MSCLLAFILLLQYQQYVYINIMLSVWNKKKMDIIILLELILYSHYHNLHQLFNWTTVNWTEVYGIYQNILSINRLKSKVLGYHTICCRQKLKHNILGAVVAVFELQEAMCDYISNTESVSGNWGGPHKCTRPQERQSQRWKKTKIFHRQVYVLAF